MPTNLENSAVATELEKVSFHSNPKKGNAKECLNYCTTALISHASKVMLMFSYLWTSFLIDLICPILASQVVLLVKNPPASAGDIRDTGSGWRDPWVGKIPWSHLLGFKIAQLEFHHLQKLCS